MGEVLKEASLGLAEATFTMGNFNQQVLNDVDISPIRVRSKKDNVAGNLFVLIIVLPFECRLVFLSKDWLVDPMYWNVDDWYWTEWKVYDVRTLLNFLPSVRWGSRKMFPLYRVCALHCVVLVRLSSLSKSCWKNNPSRVRYSACLSRQD